MKIINAFIVVLLILVTLTEFCFGSVIYNTSKFLLQNYIKSSKNEVSVPVEEVRVVVDSVTTNRLIELIPGFANCIILSFLDSNSIANL